MTIRRHRGDVADLTRYQGAVAVDTETMGLDAHRDRLCVVQLSAGDGSADVVQIPGRCGDAPNLKSLLADASILKIFHFARFDLAVLCKAFGIMPAPVYCTKIASRLTRTYTDKHGLKDLVRDLLGIDIPKQQQLSDWGADELSALNLPPPAFGSCPTAPGSILPAGLPTTSLRIRDRTAFVRFAAFSGNRQRRRGAATFAGDFSARGS